MAQKVLVQLIDDLDGEVSDDVSTVQFGLDGVTYEIDLSDANADRLRDALTNYVANARRVGGRKRSGTRALNGVDAPAVREWAAANGVELADRGRIPTHVVESYNQAQREQAPVKAPRKRARR